MQPGHILSRKYLLRRRLAEGGMGEVWLARNQRTQGDCAIKILLSTLARNPEALRRFVQEARATGQLKHPGIVQVYDAGKTHDGRPYLTMELLVGESLGDRLARDKRLSPSETAVTLCQVAEAVAHAHRHGVIHRDLSMGNVFLVQPGGGGAPSAKILDFGVSKILDGNNSGTLTGTLLGSPAYMSPEQAEGADGVDERTDVWSLGILLYQCLTGRLPFEGRNHTSTMLAVITRPHDPILNLMPDLDTEFASLIEGCLVKDREERIQTASEVATSLTRVARRLVHHGAAFSPRRRLSDRLATAPTTRSFLPKWIPSAKPGVAVWLALGTGAFGILLGTLLGTALNEEPSPVVEQIAPTPPSAPTVGLQAEPPASGNCQPPERKKNQDGDEPDLARAVEKGLASVNTN